MTLSEPIVYLDTNHLSTLARYPEAPASRKVLDILGRRVIRLGVSMLHLMELSAPEFKDRRVVGELMDEVPLAWGRWVIEIIHEEIRSAIMATMGLQHSFCVYYETMDEAYASMPPEAAVSVSVALDALASRPDIRANMPESTAHTVELDASFKRNAVVYQDPLEPLVVSIREDHDLERTPSGVRLLEPLDPDAVIRQVGGLSGFPAYEVFNTMHRLRLGDECFATSQNDVVDEMHACYGPYSAALLVDRSTLGRLRSAKVPFIERCGRNLADLPGLLGT